mmetsp:Transcript_12992/g.14478  ORF Transcript_12992/g.14478 Transcript_12992/m.14478 type:complete len:549 (+) Transcript_12992:299-1945(+)
MMNAPSQQQQSHRIPLRRAVYIHISDLTNAYNIDHKRLEEELSRVKHGDDKNMLDAESSHPATDEGSEISIPQKRLQPPRTGFNLCVLVGKVTIVVDKLRVDRSRVRLAEVQVGDETGTVSLRARDDQIDLLDKVSKRSGAVVLRNCTLELFQGRHIRLAVTKWGKLSVFPDNVPSTPPPPSKMNCDKNFSLIDLSLVASEMVENEQHESFFNRSETYSERNKPSNNRQPFQPAQSSHQRRPSHGNRRQTRSNRSGASTKPQALKFPEIPISDQLAYPAMQGYGYGDVYNDIYSDIYSDTYGDPYSDAVEMQQYYGANMHLPQHHRSNQESLSSAHQLLFHHQQYGMQQRQLQHMQVYHEHQQHQQQNEQRGAMMRPMQPSQVLVPSIIASPTFDTADFPSLPTIVPMRGSRHAEEGSSNLEGLSTSHHVPDVGPWRGKIFNTGSDDVIGGTAGPMNPQATVFAPTYVAPRAGQNMRSQPFQGYNPYEQRGRAFTQQQRHHSLYSQNIVYVPVPGTAQSVVLPEHLQGQANDPNHWKGKEMNKDREKS